MAVSVGAPALFVTRNLCDCGSEVPSPKSKVQSPKSQVESPAEGAEESGTQEIRKGGAVGAAGE